MIQDRKKKKKEWHSENQDILRVNHFQGQLQEFLIAHNIRLWAPAGLSPLH